MENTKLNKHYKDRLFRLVFGNRKALLELYNAVNASSYDDPETLEITTFEDVIYMGMKNDQAFLINFTLNLYEHQSSYNPNMPIRGFFYFADQYRGYVERNKLNLFSSRLKKLPLPQYVVFYNGLKEEPERTKLKLSDAFVGRPGMEACVEVTALMLNINLGNNRELMEQCRPLYDYAKFVAKVRDGLSACLSTAKAAEAAIDACIREGVMAEFLTVHRAEVIDMILTEYDEQSHIEMEREEAKSEGYEAGEADGLEQGLARGKAESVLDLLSDLGEVPEDLRRVVLEQTNLEILRKWLKMAVHSDSVEEFRKRL